jgi:hypothetical protein
VNARHVDWQQIVDALESHQDLDPALQAHVRECPACAQCVAEARELLSLLSEARLPDAPRETIARALVRMNAALGGEAHAQSDAAGRLVARLRDIFGALREVWGTLTADSLRPDPTLRGTVSAAPRMLRYETDDFAVTLGLSEDTDTLARILRGQVSPRRAGVLPSNGWVAASLASGSVEGPLDANGEFLLRGLRSEASDLSIAFGETVIRLEIPARPPERP